MKSNLSTACVLLVHSLLCAAASAVGIYGGDEAEPRRYPYAVSLQDGGNSFCGGSLVAPDVVLTAAHCQRSRKNWLGIRRPAYKAVAGRQFLDNSDEGGEYKVRREVVHPEYFVHGDKGVFQVTPELQSLRIDNDFMLVVLKKPVAEDAAALVSLNPSDSVPGDEMMLTVMGWGDTDVGEEYVPSRTLLEASGRVVSNEDCLKRRGRSVTYEDAITENELCMGEFNDDGKYGPHQQGMCSGDSGGPLVVRGEGPDTDIQVGVVSWGPCGSNKELPGVYARVSAQYEWIVQEVCKQSDHPPPRYGCPPKKKRLSAFGIFVVVLLSVIFVVASVAAYIQFKRKKEKLREDEVPLLADNSPPGHEGVLL